MALIFFDGFDHYSQWDGFAGRKWDVGSIAGIYGGRFEGQAISTYTGGVLKAVNNIPTIVFGAALKIFDYGGSLSWLRFMDGTIAQLEVSIDNITGKFHFYSNGTLLGTSSSAPPVGLWFYFEVKVGFGGIGGVECRVNGTTIFTTSASCNGSGSGVCKQLVIRSRETFDTHPMVVDDFYLLDTTGGFNDDFLGEVRVQTRYPDSLGHENDFSQSIGPHTAGNIAAMVNSPVTDLSETGYNNYSGTVGAVDSYSIGNFTVAGNIYGVQNNLVFRKGDVGERKITQTLYSSGSTFLGGTDFPCYSSYTIASKIWEKNPFGTPAPWDLVTLNAAEFGIKVVV